MTSSLLSKARVESLKERVAGRLTSLTRGNAPGLRRQHVIYAAGEPPSFLARWASRLALFCAVTLAITLVLHRVMSLPTSVALTIAVGVFAASVLVLVMAVIAGLDIWMTGREGAARVIFGSLVALALLAIPVGAAIVSRHYPDLADITTDTVSPPPFTLGALARGGGGRLFENPVAYAGARDAALQAASYPDIKGLAVPRPVPQTYEAVLQALAKLKYHVLSETAPDEENGVPGYVEFSERTLIMGFTDDVVIRVTAAEEGARIDVRSQSRYGLNDFGTNAARVRAILKEIVGRLEASAPDAAAAGNVTLKPLKERNRGSETVRKRPAPSRSDAKRAPRRKASPQE